MKLTGRRRSSAYLALDDYYGGFPPESRLDREADKIKRLASAVLIRAILDFHDDYPSSDSTTTTKAEAYAWFFDLSEEPFSYLWICELLDLEPEPLLSKVHRPEIISHLKRANCINYMGMKSLHDFSYKP